MGRTIRGQNPALLEVVRLVGEVRPLRTELERLKAKAHRWSRSFPLTAQLIDLHVADRARKMAG